MNAGSFGNIVEPRYFLKRYTVASMYSEFNRFNSCSIETEGRKKLMDAH